MAEVKACTGVKRYTMKRERAIKDLERREMLLGGGQIAQELKDAKAETQIQAGAFELEREELNGRIVQLSSENTEQKRSIQTMAEQIEVLKETKTDLSNVLGLTRGDSRQQMAQISKLQKTIEKG